VFLKSDVVSIDQQAAKQAGIRRWEMWSAAARRVVGVFVPGSNSLMDGHPWFGLASGFLAWFFLFGALVWATMVLPEIEPIASVAPIQVVLVVAFTAVWLNGVIGAWRRG
jgi:hypothetical protein